MASLASLTVWAVLLVACSEAMLRRPRYGPSGPINNLTVDICFDGSVKFLADQANLCWYWECMETVQNNVLEIQMLPRRCALGSKMPYSYDKSLSNPCSVNFNTKISFECTRAQDFSVHKEPACFKDYVCHNNGTATYDERVCWCQCPEEWSGNFDCSEPKEKPIERNETRNSTECIQLEPPCDLANGCENNGICHNLCGDFWCECSAPFTNGKRCEGFSCDANPCSNGGTCNRGADGIGEVSRCMCPPGFYGFLCEFGRADVRSTTARAAATQPAATQPAATQPAATQPAATQPAATQPGATQPAATQPAATQPAATQPVATQPAATQPAATQPAATQPAATQPVATQPAATQPATTQPATTQSAATQPAATQPAATQAPVTQQPTTITVETLPPIVHTPTTQPPVIPTSNAGPIFA